jgi:RNA-binding protein Musashi
MQEQHVLDGKQVECKRAVPMGYVDKPAGGPGPMGATRPQMGGQMGGPGGAGGIPPRYNPEKIFVGGLPISCDDNKLREYFSKYGVIVDAVVMIDRDLQRHRGFGYVLFQDPASVDATVAEHDQHQIDGKWVDVKRCVVQENAPGMPQSGPMRKGFGKAMAPMPGVSGTMPGYYQRPVTGGYGGADYGTAGYGARPAMPMAGGYGAMPAAGGYGARPGGYGGADPYGSGGYGAMPGYSTGYAGYGEAPA